MTAKRRTRLSIGAVVRHRFDGARGRVVEVGSGTAYRVRFDDDTEDVVTAADLRLVRPRRAARGRGPAS